MISLKDWEKANDVSSADLDDLENIPEKVELLAARIHAAYTGVAHQEYVEAFMSGSSKRPQWREEFQLAPSSVQDALRARRRPEEAAPSGGAAASSSAAGTSAGPASKKAKFPKKKEVAMLDKDVVVAAPSGGGAAASSSAAGTSAGPSSKKAKFLEKKDVEMPDVDVVVGDSVVAGEDRLDPRFYYRPGCHFDRLVVRIEDESLRKKEDEEEEPGSEERLRKKLMDRAQEIVADEEGEDDEEEEEDGGSQESGRRRESSSAGSFGEAVVMADEERARAEEQQKLRAIFAPSVDGAGRADGLPKAGASKVLPGQDDIASDIVLTREDLEKWSVGILQSWLVDEADARKPVPAAGPAKGGKGKGKKGGKDKKDAKKPAQPIGYLADCARKGRVGRALVERGMRIAVTLEMHSRMIPFPVIRSFVAEITSAFASLAAAHQATPAGAAVAAPAKGLLAGATQIPSRHVVERYGPKILPSSLLFSLPLITRQNLNFLGRADDREGIGIKLNSVATLL